MAAREIIVSGVTLEMDQRGSGRPLVFLHGGEGLGAKRPWFDLLGRYFQVIAPSHPGFGASSLPDWFSSIDDLAYLYLDLIGQLGCEDAVLAGSGFGGWIAAEIAVRNTSGCSALVLVDPLGIKAGGITDRDIVDMHAIPYAEFLNLAWADPAKGQVNYSSLSDAELAAIARGREAFVLFGWKPYMHNPRLRHWLHRIDVPTLLLWGEQDRIVTPAYREAWHRALPNAAVATIPQAGHYPHWEQPEDFTSRVLAFAEQH